ncbi:hypothetical protein WJX72_005881 [[Myrmecia] bisecta]|uniref:Uncharacterized protein n=1 Tax=[Myrmecia] bisecta TaxID=41462 RepID=A0AAW1P704_9CHLO
MLDMQASTSVVLKGPLAPTTRAVKCGVTSALLLYPGPGGVMCVEDAGVKVDLQVSFDRRRSRLTTSKNLKVGIHLIPAELDRVLVPDKAWPTAASGQSVSLGFWLEARGIEYSAPESLAPGRPDQKSPLAPPGTGHRPPGAPVTGAGADTCPPPDPAGPQT